MLAHPDSYNNRFYQSYIVLSYCRMLHDLQNGFPGSKPSGAVWAKKHLDPMWAKLIDRTWDARPKPEITVRQREIPGSFRRRWNLSAMLLPKAMHTQQSMGLK